MGKRIKLSQCMIVKNEEKNIGKALSWGKGIVYEQIVVDTGSTDRTVEIAERMGAKVFHYQWDGDFSAAKNHAIGKAAGDWIAFLDADEYFTENDAQKILPLLAKNETMPPRERFHVIKCTLLNLNDQGVVFSSMEQTRLFRRGSVSYANKIHERLIPRLPGYSRCLNVGDTLVIYHTGYSPGAYRDTGKLERNLAMIRSVLREEPENWDYWSYLGDTLVVKNDYEEAEAAYRMVVGHMDEAVLPSRVDMAFINLVRIFISQPGTEAEQKLKDLYRTFGQSGSNCPDVDYWMGLYFLSQKNREAGCLHFERVLANLETYSRGASLASSGELKLIYSSLEHAYIGLGEPQKAVKYGVLALRLDKYQGSELKALIVLMKDEPLEALAGFFGKLYDLSLLRDKLFLIRTAKEAGSDPLFQRCYQLLSPEERRWLDRKAESPYALPPTERSERYPSITCKNSTDTGFLELLEEIRREGAEHLAGQMREHLEDFRRRQGNYDVFLACFCKYSGWGRLVPEAGVYEAFEKRAASLKENWGSFLWLYGHLGDFRSKRAVTAILDSWLHMGFHLLDQAKEGGPCFLDPDLIPSADGMVYLDISASGFQSVWDFIQAYGETYQDIYCYAGEVPEGSQLPQRITAYKNVTILDGLPDGIPAGPDGPLFIKLDMGGGLLPLLDRYQELIRRCRPVLAMCADAGYEELWMAARRLHETVPDYRFYLRYHGGNLIPTEYVLFAL